MWRKWKQCPIAGYGCYSCNGYYCEYSTSWSLPKKVSEQTESTYSHVQCTVLWNPEFGKNRQKPNVAKMISYNFFRMFQKFHLDKISTLAPISWSLSWSSAGSREVGLHEISIISELMILTRWFKNDLLADEKNDQKNHKTDNLSDIYRFLKLIKSIILTKRKYFWIL